MSSNTRPLPPILSPELISKASIASHSSSRDSGRFAYVKIDKVFIGSCTNSRIEDLRSAAKIVLAAGPEAKLAEGVYAMIVPGSGLIKQHAEAEGLDVIFKRAGFDWREAGCSLCLGMNPDQLAPG